MAKNDRFAAIAATKINTAGKDLHIARTRKPETRRLPVTAGAPVLPPMEDAAKALEAAVEQLRKDSAVWLRELAPKLQSFRRRQEFDRFQWRISDGDLAAAMDGVPPPFVGQQQLNPSFWKKRVRGKKLE